MSGRSLFLESVAGIAGDMFVAACVDAGLVDADEVRATPEKLGLAGVEVVVQRVPRATVDATHVEVRSQGDEWKRALGEHRHGKETFGHAHTHPHGIQSHKKEDGGRNPGGGGPKKVSAGVPGHGREKGSAGDHEGPRAHGHPRADEHWHTHYPDLVDLLERSRLDPPARDFAARVFRLLAEAEAQAHGVPVDHVAFHEVGAVDSIVDVAMAGVCVGRIAPDRILASPVKLGRGTVRILHGTHPVPPPASARLVVGFPVAEVPDAIEPRDVELSTPTGLAILRALEPTFVEGWPPGTVTAQGMGAGTMDLGAYPNVFRVVLLEDAVSLADKGGALDLPFDTDQVVEISCNLDDETPERVGWLVERTLALGALDAWATPVVGKKSRPAIWLTLLVTPDALPRFVDFLLRNSSTFGLRHRTWDRHKLVRTFERRHMARGDVTFVVGRTTDGELVKEKPEFEDLRRIWQDDPEFTA